MHWSYVILAQTLRDVIPRSVSNLRPNLAMADWHSGPKDNPLSQSSNQGAVSIRKTVLPGMAIPMLKIRRPNGRLIFNMEIAIRR